MAEHPEPIMINEYDMEVMCTGSDSEEDMSMICNFKDEKMIYNLKTEIKLKKEARKTLSLKQDRLIKQDYI